MKTQVVLENIGIHYPGRVLFEEVNWTLHEGMRVAMAGRNGSGKSTLLRILAGQLEPHDGTRTIAGGRRLKIGYLDQTLVESAVTETLDLKENSASPLDYIQQRLLKKHPETDLGTLNWEIDKILTGLGFNEKTLHAPMNELSGGWLLRMFIAASLLDKPDILLLDEPTNHLDLSTIQWLEDFLAKDFEGSLVLVTHDVALQKRVTDSLAVLHGGNFYFRPNQSDYLTFLDSLTEEKRLLQKQIETTEKELKEQQRWVREYRAKARMASRTASRIKVIGKLEVELKSLRKRWERLHGFKYDLRFRFRMDEAGSRFPLSANNASFRYTPEDPWILKDVSFDIRRGQTVAIVGDNGAGKTTLLNTLTKRLHPEKGTVSYGHGVDIGFFGQHQLEELSLEDSVLDNLRARAEGANYEQLRGWLGAFGFRTEEDITKKTKLLSGGEKSRLALLRILASPCNVCLLDEPTNHLDIETQELLVKAIRLFEGTVVFVSHNREFISHLAERIIHISIDHKVTDHIGNLDTFIEKYPEIIHRMQQVGPAKKTKVNENKASKNDYEERKKRRNRIRSLQNKTAACEKVLENLNEEKHILEEECSSPTFYDPPNEERRQGVFDRIAAIDKELHAQMIEWEKLSLELEGLQAEEDS